MSVFILHCDYKHVRTLSRKAMQLTSIYSKLHSLYTNDLLCEVTRSVSSPFHRDISRYFPEYNQAMVSQLRRYVRGKKTTEREREKEREREREKDILSQNKS